MQILLGFLLALAALLGICVLVGLFLGIREVTPAVARRWLFVETPRPAHYALALALLLLELAVPINILFCVLSYLELVIVLDAVDHLAVAAACWVAAVAVRSVVIYRHNKSLI